MLTEEKNLLGAFGGHCFNEPPGACTTSAASATQRDQHGEEGRRGASQEGQTKMEPRLGHFGG